MNPAENLNAALQLHQAGNLAQAEVIYRQVLAENDLQADAWHLLGVLHYQRGQFPPAIAHLERAVQLRPGEPLFLTNLGEAYRASRQWQAAEDCYRRALDSNPQYASAMNNLGVVFNQQGRADAGLEWIDRALRLKPDYAEAHYNRGLTLKNLGRETEAMAAYQEALRLNPRYAAAWNNLGLVLYGQGQAEQALECYANAIRLAPHALDAHNNQGNALRSLGRSDAAAESFHRALAINPRAVEPINNLGTLARAAGRGSEAIEWYRQALAIKPDYVEAIGNLGNALKDQNRFAEAVEHYDRALAIDPNYIEAHIGRATIWLVTGDFARGWPEFDWRWKRSTAVGVLDATRPIWDGSPLAGRTILLTAEQGLGDTLQFVRYARQVKERGGRVLLECQPPLASLLARTPGIDQVYPQGQPVAGWDVQAPLMGLPGIFGTTLETIPADVPYVFADRERADQWRDELSSDRLQVGIAWRGNPRHPNDRARSFKLSEFNALASDRLQFYSLQKDLVGEEREHLSRQLQAIDLSPRLDDFETTAAIVANLDLVITCDSSIAHLAASLGARVWVAVPFAPDWRWLLEREDNPWYPTLRLFRQPRSGDWSDVFGRIRTALDELVRQKE